MTLQLRFWGTRGSVPAPGPATVRYGGNTPCVEVRTDTNQLVILDAGTGIRQLGHSLVQRADGQAIVADIFLTHTHWDHIQGIPFFAPIFQRGNRFTMYGPGGLKSSVGQVVRDQMASAVFPVPFDALEACVEFCEIGDGQRLGNGYKVATFAVQHPGGALAYRFAGEKNGDASFVYVSDNELGARDLYELGSDWRDRLVEFVRGATVLVHDAAYTAEEYERHRGWGHSTYEDAVTLALAAGVPQLVLYHHKPERTDDELDRCLEASRALARAQGGGLAVTAAMEGMTLSV